MSLPIPVPQIPSPAFVGRDAELAHLQQLFKQALNSQRQIVFVTGEPGIGKTALVETFLSGVRGQRSGNGGVPPTDLRPPIPEPWMGRGHCIEHYGVGEAYRPVLDALGQLCRGKDGNRVIEVLKQYAPTWLLQMPSLLATAELDEVQKRTHGTTRERMLREIVEALTTLAAEKLLVLVLEDLHWSDPSTLDFLALLAQQREAARLFIIGTYRPTEIVDNDHPLCSLTQELFAHKQGEELPLPLLYEAAVTAYATARLEKVGGNMTILPTLAQTVYQRTEGNPLFMVNLVDYLLAQNEDSPSDSPHRQTRSDIPSGIRHVTEKQLARLSLQEQQLLEVASIAGMEFPVAAVATERRTSLSELETTCRALAQRGQFIQVHGVSMWPDGTVSTQYRFLHSLYQQVLTDRIPAGQHVTLHRCIGERKEEAYSQRAREIAAELAVHFEQGRDYSRAVQYLHTAAKNALCRYAYRETINHLTKGLQLLELVPETPERKRQVVEFSRLLVSPMMALEGEGSAALEQACTQLCVRSQHLGESTSPFFGLLGLEAIHLV